MLTNERLQVVLECVNLRSSTIILLCPGLRNRLSEAALKVQDPWLGIFCSCHKFHISESIPDGISNIKT
jgi:hypothetical protein